MRFIQKNSDVIYDGFQYKKGKVLLFKRILCTVDQARNNLFFPKQVVGRSVL